MAGISSQPLLLLAGNINSPPLPKCRPSSKGRVPVCLWTHRSGTNVCLSSAALAWMPRPRLWKSARAGLWGLPRLPGHPAYRTASNMKQREHSSDFENCVLREQTPKPSLSHRVELFPRRQPLLSWFLCQGSEPAFDVLLQDTFGQIFKFMARFLQSCSA